MSAVLKYSRRCRSQPKVVRSDPSGTGPWEDICSNPIDDLEEKKRKFWGGVDQRVEGQAERQIAIACPHRSNQPEYIDFICLYFKLFSFGIWIDELDWSM